MLLLRRSLSGKGHPDLKVVRVGIQHLKDLQAFCDLNCDRFSFLTQWLSQRSIGFQVLETPPFRHFLIIPGGQASFRQDYRKKFLVAHYDRVPQSPGANDNSASVFQLLDFALELEQSRKKHNCLIILSDGEELQGQNSLKEQGAYLLAEKLKSFQLQESLMLVLDLCGIGDTLVYGTSQERKDPDSSALLPPLLQDLLEKHSRGIRIKQLQYFSDDLGFIAHAFPTLLLSMVPWQEKEYLEQGKMPPSWRNQHSLLDDVETLEGQSFRIMGSLLRQLGDLLI